MKRILSIILAIWFLAVPSVTAKDKVTPTIADVISHALLSVGHVTGTFIDQDDEKHNYGCSAFAIDARKYLTAEHCVGQDMKIDGVAARAVKEDKQKDLAVLLADDKRPALTIRDTPLTRFENAIGLGYGYSWTFPTVTFHRALMFKFAPEGSDIYPGTWYQGGFIGGMSGGAVIDESGQVVGVVQRGNEVSGYGVDVDTIKEFLNAK